MRSAEPPPGSGRKAMPEIAIVAAMEREIHGLVRKWRVAEREFSGRRFRFFESADCVAVCSGVGPDGARRATEAIISLYKPGLVQSVGFAGALDNTLIVGQVLEIRQVVDARDGSRTDTGLGSAVLVSFPSVAGPDQKAKLAAAYQAQAVDMEAASVAKGAEAHGLRFAAIKVISDEAGFPMPSTESFVAKDGEFQAGRFALHAAVRPWMWGTVLRLARNSKLASNRLSAYLEQNLRQPGPVPSHASS
jgi:adenosylhomocysteine nucleosidase